VGVATAGPEPRDRLLIYAVGPAAEVETRSSAGLRPALVGRVFGTVAVLAAAAGGAAFMVWLILAPVLPDGAAAEQLWQPWPSQMVQPTPDHPTAPTVVAPSHLTTRPTGLARTARAGTRTEQHTEPRTSAARR